MYMYMHVCRYQQYQIESELYISLSAAMTLCLPSCDMVKQRDLCVPR